MKIKILAVIALLVSIFVTSCDDTTDSIGNSLTDNTDLLNVMTDSFGVSSRSIVSGAVLSRNTTGYLGKIRDPETGNYITGNFMAQFGTLEDYKFPEKDSLVIIEGTDTIKLKDIAEDIKDSKIVADSCNIRLFYTSFYGDSLATMNLSAYEMNEAMKENVNYYSDFNPKELVRTSNGIKVNKTYTLADMTISDEDRADESAYTPNIKINLNGKYTDKNGVVYNNYGTYLMRKYYENPANFKNSYNFIHNVCPGFYFEMNDGLGTMAYITVSQLNVYFKYASGVTNVGTSSFSATEEVLQTTNISNDNQAIDDLANNDNTCTYLKTPAGIFTELDLPVDEIISGHENDTINIAKITLKRINNATDSKYALATSSTLLMIPKGEMQSFFEKNKIIDNKKSYVATFSSSSNSYTFGNISDLITYLYNIKKSGLASDPDWLNENREWNKVLIIPVTITTNTSGQVVKVVHDMSLTSTKLVKGDTEHGESPLKISVIYSKFNHD